MKHRKLFDQLQGSFDEFQFAILIVITSAALLVIASAALLVWATS